MSVPPTSPLVASRWLRPLRVLWLATLALTLIALFTSVPILYHQGHQICMHASCNGPQLTPQQMRSLHRSGELLDMYAAAAAGIILVFGLVYCAVATLIFVQRSQERMALFSAFFLLIFGGFSFPGTPATLASAYPVLRIPSGLVQMLGAVLLVLFFFLFPNGRFVPRWSVWLVPILPLLQAGDEFFPDSAYTLNRLPPEIGIVPFYGILLFLVVAQIYRFRNVSTPVERQQTKWVLFGVGVGMTGFLVLVGLGLIVPPSFNQSIYAVILPGLFIYAFILLIPLSISLAIFRYNLWEADTLINRTLVYGSLTVTLAALYIAGVIALQALFRIVTGQSSDLAIAIATLTVAALFNPWRHRLQSFIDRRFYRRKYDAGRALAGLTARLRDEVDLEELSGDLMTTVQETVQPAHISLWLPQETGR